MGDGAVVVGPFDVQAQGGAVRGVAQAALQAGVGLHRGVACLVNWSASHLRASEMRMRREQRLLPLPSRGTSRAGVPPMRSSKTCRQRVALASVYVHLGVIVDLGCFAPKLS